MSDIIPEPITSDPIAEAITRLKDDPGAIFEPAVLILLRTVRHDEAARWSRYRQAIKDTGAVSMGDLERYTSSPTKQDFNGSSESFFPEDTPWPDPVDGATLLDDITKTLARFVIADKEALRAAALWCVFTWFIDVVQVAPLANIYAPEKRCGKTIMLSALSLMSLRPLQTSNIGSAALFRSIELWRPSLFIDETDSFLSNNDETRGILNAGHTRESAHVMRCVGDDHIPTRFNVWGAKALCGIGSRADTLTDRSIPLLLRRKKPGERVEKLRHADATLWKHLRSRISRFAQDNAATVSKLRPAEIDGLNDRANDCWEPLLAIAEAAGGDWPKLAKNAAIALHGLESEPLSIGVELLADVKAAFDGKGISRMRSEDLLKALISDEEAPWATWNRGKPMTFRQLSTKLGEFEIKSKDLPLGSRGQNNKSYELDDFADAFSRYLSVDNRLSSAIPSKANNDAASSELPSARMTSHIADKTPQPQGEEVQQSTWDDSDVAVF